MCNQQQRKRHQMCMVQKRQSHRHQPIMVHGIIKEVITMLSDKERKCLNETRLRNLQRKYTKLKEHPELINEARETQKEIQELQSAMT